MMNIMHTANFPVVYTSADSSFKLQIDAAYNSIRNALQMVRKLREKPY